MAILLVSEFSKFLCCSFQKNAKLIANMQKSHFRSLVVLVVIVAVASIGAVVISSSLSKPTQLGGQASTANTIPLENQRETVPDGALILNNGVGITNGAAMNQGNFQVEAFCSRKGLGSVSQNSTNWLCGSYTLQVKDFDEICGMTYTTTNAFVIRTGTSSTVAFNWRCYAFPASTTTTSTSGVACGEPCGGQNGFVLPTNCANGGICGNNANGGTSGNRCLPRGVSGYVTGGGICKGDPNRDVWCINKSDGTAVPDEAGI